MKHFAKGNLEETMRLIEELLNVPVGQEVTIQRDEKGFVIVPKAESTSEEVKPYFGEGYESIPDREGWIHDPNGNEAYGIPIREDEKGDLWIGDVKVLTDTDEDYLGVQLPDGTIIKKITQAPKKVCKNGTTFNVLADYQKSQKYRQVIADQVLYVTPNLSKDGDTVRSLKAKENDPIVRTDYPTSVKLATQVGYGKVESELMHDTEYAFDWIYNVYVKKDKSAMENEYWLWLQTIENTGSVRLLAQSILSSSEVGTRDWGYYDNFGNVITFRSSLKRSTVR